MMLHSQTRDARVAGSSLAKQGGVGTLRAAVTERLSRALSPSLLLRPFA